MFCTDCGARNAEISNYCKQCGHKLDRAAAARISEEAFDRALPLEEQVSALLERAYRLRKSGELAAAVRLCEEALRLNPESTSVHSLLGQIHEQMGNHDSAIQEYERVMQLNPGSIADRVKLDELRGDRLPAPLHPRASPHIVMSDHSLPNPNGRQLLGMAGIAGVLMLLGGLLALQFLHSRDDKANLQAAAGPGHSANRSGAGTSQPEALPGAGAGTNNGASNPAGAVASNPGAPVTPNYVPYASYSPPPVYVQVPPRPIYVRSGGSYAASAAARRGGRLPSMANTVRSIDDGGGEHVRLPDEPISITVHPDGGPEPPPLESSVNPPKGSNTPPAKTLPKGNAANGGARAIPPKITIHTNGDGGSSADSSVTPPETQAQSQIAIASDKFKKGEYDGAIKAYRRSLSGAGSQSGYVFQQMGICFQRIKDKASAIDNFTRAIAAYQKLELANQQVDLARAGIRVCENGIKLCNAE